MLALNLEEGFRVLPEAGDTGTQDTGTMGVFAEYQLLSMQMFLSRGPSYGLSMLLVMLLLSEI